MRVPRLPLSFLGLSLPFSRAGTFYLPIQRRAKLCLPPAQAGGAPAGSSERNGLLRRDKRAGETFRTSPPALPCSGEVCLRCRSGENHSRDGLRRYSTLEALSLFSRGTRWSFIPPLDSRSHTISPSLAMRLWRSLCDGVIYLREPV